jgi:hypothetical protein
MVMIKRFNLDQCDINLIIKKEGILLSPVAKVPPLAEWDKLFIQAKRMRPDPEKEIDPGKALIRQSGSEKKTDATIFSDWDITMNDGID